MRLPDFRKYVALIVCLAPLAQVASAGDVESHRVPFLIDGFVEKSSPGSRAARDGTFLVERWMQAPVAGLLTEFLIDTSITYVGAPIGQSWPSIAFDGTNYLVVWTDVRSPGRRFDIYGARVSQSGVVMDPIGKAISSASNNQRFPCVAFDGTNYLVVWGDYRNDDADIFGARVDTSGAVLDSLGIAIANSSSEEDYPYLSFDGTNYLVVWQDSRSGSDRDIYGARVDTGGNVIDSAAIAVSTPVGNQQFPSVAFDGVNYFVVWVDGRSGSDSNIYGARVDPSGAVMDTLGIAISTSAKAVWFSSVCFDGSNYLVVWSDARGGAGVDIYGARADTSGVVLDTLGIPICTTADAQFHPSLAFDGTNFLALWEDHRNSGDPGIYGTRIDTSGVVLDTSGIAISTAAEWQTLPSIAFGGTEYFAVWGDRRWGLSESDIYGSRIDVSGTVLDSSGVAISTAAHSEWFPSVSSDGTDYLVAWGDYRNRADSDIYCARVNSMGAVLDPAGLAVCTAAGWQSYPSAAFGGTAYFVVWVDGRTGLDIYGARVDTSGAVLDPSGILMSTASDQPYNPSVCFDGTNFFVVWDEYVASHDLDIYGTRVDTSGTVLDPLGIAVCSADSIQANPSISFDGTNYLVVWADDRSGVDDDVYGARVDTSGNVVDPSGFVISAADSDQVDPAVSFDGNNYLVVWEDNRGGTDDIYGARVDTAGAVLDSSGIVISDAPDDQWSPSVVFDGTQYSVVWYDYRSGMKSDIYGARVDPSGTVLDPSGVELINESYDRYVACIARGSGNQTLLVFQGFVTGAYNTQRVLGAFYTATGIQEGRVSNAQSPRLELLQNVPNPFHVTTDISYSLPVATPVSLKVFDSSGRLVSVLLDEERPVGRHKVAWDGRERPSGTYFYRLQAGQSMTARKMILLK